MSNVQLGSTYYEYPIISFEIIVMSNVQLGSTGCPQKNYTVCFLAVTPSNLHQIQKGRSVLKSARSEDFKTVLDFKFWPSRSSDIGVRRHQGSFSVFTIFARNCTDLAGLITLLDSQNLNLTYQIISLIFSTQMTQLLTKKN